MELKLRASSASLRASSCSNRTFMELKYSFPSSLSTAKVSSNRTFMELKFFSKLKTINRVKF